MSTPNDDALRCANDLEYCYATVDFDGDMKNGAAHIRRLVAENEALTNGRHVLQAEGKHPAPCARFCEAKSFEIEVRQLQRQIKSLNLLAKAQTDQLSHHRAQADKYIEAINTLQSERDANAILTAENTAQRELLRQAVEALTAAISDDEPYIVRCGKAIAAINEHLKEQP